METWAKEITAELRSLGHDVDLRALPGRPDGGAPGTGAILRFGMAQAWSILTGHADWDAIHGGDMAIWPLAWAARLRRRVPVVLTAHGTDVAFADRPGVAGQLYRLWLRAGAGLLPEARIAANSRATAVRAEAAGFGRVTVIPLAVRAGPDQTISPPEPFLLFAGRLVRRKGLSWFVREVLPRLPGPLALKVAGTPWDDGETAALADPRVEHLGALPQPELHALMARATAVVIPNLPAGPGHFEGFGLVAPEAASAGAIVLASDLDGFRDSVIDGETGILLPPADADAWTARIAEVASWDLDARTKFITRSRDAARRTFAWERVAAATAALYEPPDHPARGSGTA